MLTSPATETSPPRTRRRDRDGGFTLVEMALALAVIGLLAALGLPFLRASEGVTALRMKTVEVVALLRLERNAALKSGRMSKVLVSAEDGVIRSSLTGAAISLPASITLRVASRAGGFEFYPDGRASGGQLRLQSGKASSLISINDLTAAIVASEP